MSELDMVAEVRSLASRLIAPLTDDGIEIGFRLHEIADEFEARAQRRIAEGQRFRARQVPRRGLVRVVRRLRDLMRGAA